MSLRILLTILAAATLSACAAENSAVSLESRSFAVEENAVPTAGAAGAAGSVAHLLPATGPSYVTLTVMQGDKSSFARGQAITSGSGYVVSGDGTVMTAAHVAVAKGNEVSARAANGKVYSGKVIAINPTNDMAIVKLQRFSGPAVNPALPGCVNKGDLVFTLGKPHAQGDLARVGTLDSRHFGRAVAYGKFGYPDALVLRMSTQKGESGGPLFDGNGRFIGMVVSTLSDAAGNSINMAHAVPSNALAHFLCRETGCSSNWAAIADRPVDGCNGA